MLLDGAERLEVGAVLGQVPQLRCLADVVRPVEADEVR
jgi:hypothetical protein